MTRERILARLGGVPMMVTGAAALLLLAHGLLPAISGSGTGPLTWGLDSLALVLLLAAGWRHSRSRIIPEDAPTTSTPLPRPTEWSRDVLRHMDWKRFEEVCAAYYEETGVPCKAMYLGQVGGIDVRLFQDGPEKPSGIARCKASSVHRLDGRPVVDLVGAMARQRITKGFYMTREGFHEDAVEVAAKHGITLVDSHILLSLIQRLPPKAQKHLLEFATGGDWSTPTCPACGVKMDRRSRNGAEYWRCPNAVRCGKRLKIHKLES
ncbi:MAG: restriction endonuclease [Rhodocyclaceae bacterium]|nr:restriction endonuclease [Rhodocyclaceae bacterium]